MSGRHEGRALLVRGSVLYRGGELESHPVSDISAKKHHDSSQRLETVQVMWEAENSAVCHRALFPTG